MDPQEYYEGLTWSDRKKLQDEFGNEGVPNREIKFYEWLKKNKMAKQKKDPIAERRRKALMEHFRRMDHSLLVSFLNCWLKNSEVKYLCKEEGVDVK